MIETTEITIRAEASGHVHMDMPGHPLIVLTPANAQKMGMQLIEAARCIQERNGGKPETVIVRSSRVVELPRVYLQASAQSVLDAFRGRSHERS